MPSSNGDLTLGDLLSIYGVDPAGVAVLRHTERDDLQKNWSKEAIIASTRSQVLAYQHFRWRDAPPLWLLFWADGGLRARFYGAYRNHGEVTAERTDTHLFFDLRPDDTMGLLRDRLVIEWARDAIRWVRSGAVAASFRVVEISQTEDFPGFDSIDIPHSKLREVVDGAEFDRWRAALSSVQGIYLITDTTTGRLYVGQAAGKGGIFGRWRQYALNGHGGNRDLKALLAHDPGRTQFFQYSILRVFGLGASPAEINAAETHYKNILMTRTYGLNAN